MCVSKGRINLDGSGVALQRALDVVHLLQSVAHVAVGVSKRGLKDEIQKLLIQQKLFKSCLCVPNTNKCWNLY
jgi:hypothetical protein